MSRRDTLAIRSELLIPDTILINQPFEIRFSVTILDSVVHQNNTADEIDLILPPECEIVAGSPSWRGKLDCGITVTLQITARATRPFRDSFEGFVYTDFVPGHMNLYRTVNAVLSKEYSVLALREPSPVDPERPGSQELTTRTVVPRCPYSGAVDSLIRVELVKGKLLPTPTFNITRKAQHHLGFWIKNPADANIVKALPSRWDLSCPLYDMALNRDSTTALLVDKEIDTTTVSVEIDGTRYQVRLRVTDRLRSED